MKSSCERLTCLLPSGALLCLFLIGLWSCATKTPPEQSEIVRGMPVIFDPYFSPCTPSDGEVRLNLAALPGGAVDFVWNADFDKDQRERWAAEILNDLGQPIIKLSKDQSGFKKVFHVAKGRFPEIQFDSSGWLTLDERRVPVRDRELFCFLKGSWPSQWRSMVPTPIMTTSKDQVMLEFKGRDTARDLSFHVIHPTVKVKPPVLRGCGEIRWGGFFGFFANRLEICLTQYDTGKAGAIKLNGDPLMDWRLKADE